MEVERDAPAGVAARLRRAGERYAGASAAKPAACGWAGVEAPSATARGRGTGRGVSAARGERPGEPVRRLGELLAAGPRSVATIFTSPVVGWLKEETMSTGPGNALVSSERSSRFGSSAAESDSTTVRASGRATA